MDELAVQMARVKLYREKVVKLKRSMDSLVGRSAALKRRALRLQAEKQKEALDKATQKEKEREREKKLVAKTDFS